jgi:ATP-dependent helicase/nuclease subunit B
MAGWLIEVEQLRRQHIKAVQSEVNGEWTFEINGKNFTLSTRIDRIEQRADGSRAIVDYKTGAVPTKADIERGLANQLALEALVASYGTLSKESSGDISDLEYWKLAGEELKCKISLMDINIEQACERLMQLITDYDDANKPYSAQTDPSLQARYNDYEHLTRNKEWEAV